MLAVLNELCVLVMLLTMAELILMAALAVVPAALVPIMLSARLPRWPCPIVLCGDPTTRPTPHDSARPRCVCTVCRAGFQPA